VQGKQVVTVAHDPSAVEAFVVEHDASLAARVRREVRNKLISGLKNPSRSANADYDTRARTRGMTSRARSSTESQ
jgi:hypothetical protein